MTRKHTLADRLRKRQLHRTEYRQELEKAFKAEQKAKTEPSTVTADAQPIAESK